MEGVKFNANNFIRPVTTGTPAPKHNSGAAQEQGRPFSEILAEKVKAESGVSFSKHAIQRVAQRNVDLGQASMERLREGLRLAAEKGLGETLILVDQTAFIVNARANRVITTVNGSDLKGNVFTNIEGTVII
ncbi:MAG: TIGR02530 family flagellar biosynthesis protein [Eubacteriales bacterium]